MFHISTQHNGSEMLSILSLQEPFPIGANVRVRPGKSRNAGYEENR
ncbi:AML1, partial [Trifolium medium]|nr:AML1 [Trifolium medium]